MTCRTQSCSSHTGSAELAEWAAPVRPVTLITPDEERKWREIERGLGRRFKRMPWRVNRQEAQSRASYA